MIYKCRNCGELFAENEAEYYEPIPGYVEDYDYENYMMCPSCGCLDAEVYYEEEDE